MGFAYAGHSDRSCALPSSRCQTGDVMLRHILFKRIALVLYVYVYTNAILSQRKFKASSWPELLFTDVLADKNDFSRVSHIKGDAAIILNDNLMSL